MGKITVELPEPLHQFLERYALVKGSTPERIASDLLIHMLNLIRDVEDTFFFRFIWIPKSTREIMESAYKRGEIKKLIDPEKTAITLGRIVTSIEDAYRYIPREINLAELKQYELDALREAIAKIEGRPLDPVDYLTTLFNEIEDVIEAFGLKIEKEKGRVKKITVKNPLLLSSYYGHIPRIYRR